MSASSSLRPLSGRYPSFVEREEIAILHAVDGVAASKSAALKAEAYIGAALHHGLHAPPGETVAM
jgi:hypothetical protein